MIKIVIHFGASNFFNNSGNFDPPCRCRISDGKSKKSILVFDATPGATVSSEEMRCWATINKKYGTTCSCGNSWDEIYLIDWKTEEDLARYSGCGDVEYFPIENATFIDSNRIIMPDGTDGLNCFKCEKYHPYVEANNDKGYICPSCRLF